MTYNGKLDSMNPSLTLEHRLSKVTVTITNWEDYGETMPEISNFIIQTSGTITISDGIVAGSGSTDITPLHDETDKSYAAIIAPGSGFDIKLTVNGKDKTAHYDGSLDSGDAYSFNLTLKDNDLILTPTGTLPDWERQTKKKQYNKKANRMKGIYLYMTMCMAAMTFTSCTNDLEESLLSTETLMLTVGDYPAFQERTDTRAIGTFDPGKTA